MNKVDLEHKLLKGSPIPCDDLMVHRVKIGEMVDFEFGYSQFQQLLGVCCMDDDKIKGLFREDIEPSVYLYITANIYNELKAIRENKIEKKDYNKLFIVTLPSFLMLIFRETVVFNSEYGVFVVGDEGNQKILNQEKFNKFRDILKERNGLKDIDEIDDNPADERARQLLNQRKKLREKLKKKKAEDSDEEGLTLADLVSVFSEAEKMCLTEVYEKYDIYQFNNQFNRLKIMDDYHVGIQSLLAGAKKEDVNLQHWISKIKKQEN